MKKNILLFLAILMLLPGCYKVSKYRARSFRLLRANFGYCDVKNNVLVQAKRFDVDERIEFFGDRGKWTLGVFEIIYCVVHNMSTVSYQFSPAYINLNLLEPKEVFNYMKTSTGQVLSKGLVSGGITTFSGIAAFTAATAASFGDPKFWIIAIYMGIHGLPILFMAGFLPLLGKAIKSAVMNGRLKKDLRDKIVNQAVIIEPGSRYEGILCVASSDYTPQFDLMLQNITMPEQSLIFGIDLHQNK